MAGCWRAVPAGATLRHERAVLRLLREAGVRVRHEHVAHVAHRRGESEDDGRARAHRLGENVQAEEFRAGERHVARKRDGAGGACHVSRSYDQGLAVFRANLDGVERVLGEIGTVAFHANAVLAQQGERAF